MLLFLTFWCKVFSPNFNTCTALNYYLLFILQTHIFLYKPSEKIQSEPLEFFYHPTKPMSWRDKATQTMESSIHIEPRTHLPCTLNRRLKRSSPIFDDFPTRAKLPSLKPEPVENPTVKVETDAIEEDSGFCEPILGKSSLPMILLEARESPRIKQ